MLAKSIDICYPHYLLLKWTSPLEKQVLQMESWLVIHSAPSAEVTEERDAKTRYQKGKADCASVYINDREIDVMDAV